MEDAPTIAVDKELVIFAHNQNISMTRKLRHYIAALIVLCLMTSILALWLSDVAMSPRVKTPYFQNATETKQYKPMPDNPVNFNDASHFGKRWAMQLTSLSFDRLFTQLENSKELFSEGVFERDYFNPLMESGTFSDIENNLLTITSAKVGIVRADTYLTQNGLEYVLHVPIVQTVLGLSGKPETRRATVKLTLIPVTRDIKVEGLLINKLGISSR